jgi:hypothetical protein
MAYEIARITNGQRSLWRARKNNVCKIGSFLVIYSNKAYMRVKILLRKSFLLRNFSLAGFTIARFSQFFLSLVLDDLRLGTEKISARQIAI